MTRLSLPRRFALTIPRGRWFVEVIGAAAGYELYDAIQARTSGDADEAISAGRSIFRLERTLRRAHKTLGPGHGMTMTIVGDGPQRQRLERYLVRHHMTDWVEVTGHLPRAQVAEHLQRADVFLAPASLESFGIAALEAHAAGLPVIGRLGTGLADYERDGIDGRLVDSDRAMAAAIVELVRAREQGEAWWVDQPAVDQFSWAEVMNRAEELYAHAGRLVANATPERAPAR